MAAMLILFKDLRLIRWVFTLNGRAPSDLPPSRPFSLPKFRSFNFILIYFAPFFDNSKRTTGLPQMKTEPRLLSSIP